MMKKLITISFLSGFLSLSPLHAYRGTVYNHSSKNVEISLMNNTFATYKVFLKKTLKPHTEISYNSDAAWLLTINTTIQGKSAGIDHVLRPGGDWLIEDKDQAIRLKYRYSHNGPWLHVF